MNQKQKDQIKTILALMTRRHPLVCEALAIAARGSLPHAEREALLAIVPTDAMASVNAAAVAELAQLVSAMDSLEVTP